MNKPWTVAGVVLVAVMAGFLLAGTGTVPKAYGQVEGRTSGNICLIGQVANQYAPIVLVDVPNQTIMVYKYSYLNDRIELTSARTYQYDKLLKEYQIKGVTVDQVRQAVGAR
jgi:hypothetical protein